MENFIIGNVNFLVTEGPKEVLWNLLKKDIDYKIWTGIFVEAGDTVAIYENRGNDKSGEFLNSGEDEQGDFRKIVFHKDNMKKLAGQMYKDYVLKKRLMLTLANENGINISMREDTYLDEMLKLIENTHDDLLLDKAAQYKDEEERWQEIYNGDEFAKVKNEMI